LSQSEEELKATQTKLTEWESAFVEKNATEVKEKITGLETNLVQTEGELKTWTAIFGKQNASQVKEEYDNYRNQTEVYRNQLTNLGVKDLTDWETTVQG
jgi:molecular chaperone GrpE (heat shock protein)